ncbi:MAG TPA: adenylate/guanylate cyclase domain-containing protein, partial [Candidatus Dormibacteraeota bacterium]|nr:adenylate/guanylate cyclase domain-containing protein [Candidatus Dormibacteraeota bacterium]
MERKLVTVLFADAIGSTSLADRLDPERLRAVLDAYFAAMASAVDAWGGTVEKFIGDAVMAVFGVPAVREDDAERALNAAMEMMERLRDLNVELQSRHGISLQMRVGVNTGEVVAGVPTDGSQRLVSGDPVNVAARLQGEAEPDTILVGDRTYLAARHSFLFSEPIELTLKGKKERVRARQVLGVAPESVRGIPGLASPLVGRTAELQALSSQLDEVLETQRPRLVTVLGPAGVGKSRLVREFVSDVTAGHPAARVLRGRCLAAGHGITYWALGEILRAACGIRLDDPNPMAVEKLRATVSDERTVEALAATAGISVPGTRLAQMDPQSVADELAWAWPRFANAQAAEPSVWVIEDLHWAGQPLLDMLERVIGRSTGPLLVVGTARPDLAEVHPGFGGGSEDFSKLSLRPLSDSHSKELLQAILTVADIPAPMTAQILGKAEGNPFFLEEIVRRLIEEGALVHERGRWRSTARITSTPLPDSLLALLSARIDAIPEAEKRVLQEAAVVGRVFWAEPLRRTLGDQVTPALVALERRGLVSARSTSSLASQAEYAFKHALVHDVAYASLPKARRARAHADVGAWIEQLAGDRADEFGELLAYHYWTAVAGEDADLAWSPGEREPVRLKAFELLLRAGGNARQRFAVDKSVELHAQAVGVAIGPRERLRALEDLAEDHDSSYHGEDAFQAFTEALEIARAAGWAADRARICAKLAEMMSGSPGAFKRSPDPEPVEELVTEGLAQASDEETTARLLVAFGRLSRLYRGSEPFGQGGKPDPVPLDQRIAAVEKARAIGESLDLPQLIFIANNALGLLYGMDGRFNEMLELAERELDSVDLLGSRIRQGDAVRRAAVATMSVAGQYEKGLDLAMRSLRLSRDTNPHQIMHGTFPVLQALYELGRWDEIGPILEEHLQSFAQDPAVECEFVRDGPVLGAFVAAKSGDLTRARELAGLLDDPMKDVDGASAWQARLAVALGEPDQGRRISNGKAFENRMYGPEHARSLLEALCALEGWDAVEKFLARARNQVPGLAVLGPCCDRAEGLLARARG